MISHRIRFVKNFFHSFPNFFGSVFLFSSRPKQLLHVTTASLICQELFSFLFNFDWPQPHIQPPSRTACIYYHAPDHLSSTKTKILAILFPTQKGSAQGAPCSFFDCHSTISRVPAVIRIQPTRDLAVNFSWRNTKASTRVRMVLILSMGTTLEASPICRAR